MEPGKHELKDGRLLVIREATGEDAPALLDHARQISGESDFLTFGSGEFELTEAQERAFLATSHAADNQLFLVGLIDDAVAGCLHFAGGPRPRTRHAGEFGMSVRKPYWRLGIGSLLVDTLIRWARASGVVNKINLRVRTDNEGAIRLYEQKGFVHEGTLHGEIYIDGEYFDHHWMGLGL